MSDHVAKAIRKVRKLLLPAWYLPKGTMNASDDELGEASSSCESWALVCGALVVVAVAAEIVIAWVEPPYDLFLRLSVPTDIAVALGIVGEVLLGMRNNRLQTELRRRSDVKVAAATERAGKLEKEAAETGLKLEKLRHQTLFGRQLRPAEFVKSLENKAKVPVEIAFLKSDTEAFMFASQVSGLLKAAHWDVSDPRPVAAEEMAKSVPRPAALAEAPLVGIAIVLRVETEAELRCFGSQAQVTLWAMRKDESPLAVLCDAIADNLVTGGTVQSFPVLPRQANAPPPGTLRLIIGPK